MQAEYEAMSSRAHRHLFQVRRTHLAPATQADVERVWAGQFISMDDVLGVYVPSMKYAAIHVSRK